MKKVISILIIVLWPFALHAQLRTIEQAKHLANDYIRQNKGFKSHGFTSERLVNRKLDAISFSFGGKNDNLPFYVLTDSVTPASYVIVSGDERMKPILAYGENGRWDEKDIPDGLYFLLENYRNQYELLQSDEISKATVSSKISIPNVEPMIKTTWRQEYPFNALCPSDCPSGCVATAMSQVMKYHQFPISGIGSFSYISHTRKHRCSFDFSSATFEWDKMKNSYAATTFGSENIEAISQATYACGVSVGMDYDKSGSGAYMSDVPYALIHFFGYNDNVSFRDRTYYDASEWYEMLCDELSAGRPVIYGGVDSKNGGHAFVIDGCSSESRKFHVNWGWGGNFDDYYELDALDPQTYKFSSYQDMVINLSPQIVGTFEDVFYADKFSVSSKISIGKSVVFTISDVYCFSSQSSYVVSNAKFYGRIGVGIFDKNFNFISSIDSDSIEGINNFYGYTKLTYNAKIEKTMFPENGTYYIAPYVKEKNSINPTRIRTSGGKADYIVLTVDDDGIQGDGENEEPIEIVSEWSEDFEGMSIPKNWKQEVELGVSEWTARYVLMASEELPAAAHGKGYVYINYATGLDLFNSRTVTRLITPIVSLDNNNKYNLSFQYRKQSTMPESTDILTLYYKDENSWKTLAEVPVNNQGDWRRVAVELPLLENLQLAFEGSPARGSSIFLDDIRVYDRKNEPSSAIQSITDFQSRTCHLYNMSGILIGKCTYADIDKLNLHHGTYILLTPDKKATKIQIK
ncbi:MAG: C10 family peptidase [Prevotella sp.]|nr:C10 family peptidase [Prevotella sp.]